jgi:hypothetical protein
MHSSVCGKGPRRAGGGGSGHGAAAGDELRGRFQGGRPPMRNEAYDFRAAAVMETDASSGFKVDDRAALDRHAADRELIVRHVTRSYAHQIFVDGFYSADPHPGNILVDSATLRPVPSTTLVHWYTSTLARLLLGRPAPRQHSSTRPTSTTLVH